MKKIFLLLAVVALSAASCKKDRVCTCTTTDTAPTTAGYSYSSTTETTMTKVSKKSAKYACVKTTRDYTSGGNTYTQTNDCKLK